MVLRKKKLNFVNFNTAFIAEILVGTGASRHRQRPVLTGKKRHRTDRDRYRPTQDIPR